MRSGYARFRGNYVEDKMTLPEILPLRFTPDRPINVSDIVQEALDGGLRPGNFKMSVDGDVKCYFFRFMKQGPQQQPAKK
jgi:hypothetical protein